MDMGMAFGHLDAQVQQKRAAELGQDTQGSGSRAIQLKGLSYDQGMSALSPANQPGYDVQHKALRPVQCKAPGGLASSDMDELRRQWNGLAPETKEKVSRSRDPRISSWQNRRRLPNDRGLLETILAVSRELEGRPSGPAHQGPSNESVQIPQSESKSKANQPTEAAEIQDGVTFEDFTRNVGQLNVYVRGVINLLQKSNHLSAITHSQTLNTWVTGVSSWANLPTTKNLLRTGKGITTVITVINVTKAIKNDDGIGAVYAIADGMTHIAMGTNPWTAALDVVLTATVGPDWMSQIVKSFLRGGEITRSPDQKMRFKLNEKINKQPNGARSGQDHYPNAMVPTKYKY